MNIQSIAVLAIVLVLALGVVIWLLRHRQKSGCCSSCSSCEGCALADGCRAKK